MTPAISKLLAQLTEREWSKRRQVVTALAQAGDEAVAGLCDILVSQRDDETRLASAVEALVASSGNADVALLALTSDKAPAVLCDAVVVLGRRHSLRAIPVLEQLTAHTDGNVSLAAIEALGRMGGGAGVTGLIEVVESRDFFRTFPAIEVLAKSAEPRAIDVLIGLLDEPLYALAAARGLGTSADPRSLDKLLAALTTADDALAAACAVAISEIVALHFPRVTSTQRALTPELRDRLIARLRQSWKHAEVSERAAIAATIAWVGGATAVTALLDIAGEDDNLTALTADALRQLGRQADGPILEIIHRGSSQQRLLLLPIVGGAPNGVEPLVACLQDPSDDVRAAAADTLARIGDVAAVPALFAALRAGSARVSQACVGAIQSLGSAETEALTLALVADPSAQARRAALRIIAYFGYVSAIDFVIASANDADDRLRDAALSGLPFIEDARAQNALLAAAAHASAPTRAAAVRNMAQVTLDARYEDALRTALHDPDAWVRYFACASIGRLQIASLIDGVVAALADAAGQVQVAAIEALSHFRDPRASVALERAASAPDLDVRRAAIVGLGAMGGDSALAILLEQLSAEDAAARLMALSSLAGYDTAAVSQAIRRAVFDPDETIQQSAVSLLASRTDSASTQALFDLLERQETQETAMLALVAHPELLPHMQAALETATQERSTVLTNVLLRMRRPEAEQALIDVLRLPNVFARRAATRALASVRSAAARAALRQAAAADADADVRTRALESGSSK